MNKEGKIWGCADHKYGISGTRGAERDESTASYSGASDRQHSLPVISKCGSAILQLCPFQGCQDEGFVCMAGVYLRHVESQLPPRVPAIDARSRRAFPIRFRIFIVPVAVQNSLAVMGL